MTIASRPRPRSSDVRSVESFSGSIGKISAAVYTEVVLVARVVVDGGVLPDERVDVGDGDEDPHRAAGQRLGDRELVEVARIVVVDRCPRQTAQIANAAPEARAGCVIRFVSAMTAREKSGSSPRWSIALCAMAGSLRLPFP